MTFAGQATLQPGGIWRLGEVYTNAAGMPATLIFPGGSMQLGEFSRLVPHKLSLRELEGAHRFYIAAAATSAAKQPPPPHPPTRTHAHAPPKTPASLRAGPVDIGPA